MMLSLNVNETKKMTKSEVARFSPDKTINTQTILFYHQQVGRSSSCRDQHGACKVNTEVVRNGPLTSRPDSGCTGIILWT